MDEPRVRLADEVVFRPLSEGGGVLLHLATGQYHSVNLSGAEVCRLLDGTRTLREVQDAVAAPHAEIAEQVRADVADYVASLEARGLVQVVAQQTA